MKNDTIQFRVEPQLKSAAQKASKLEHRSLSNWIEFLILERCKYLKVDTAQLEPKEEQK